MKTICFYFQIHQPFRLKRYRFFDIGNDHYYYDDFKSRIEAGELSFMTKSDDTTTSEDILSYLESGSLYHMLSHFIYNNLNMCRIESRPIADRNWEYHFFVDFEGNLNDSAVKNALRGIREEALNLKILGNY